MNNTEYLLLEQQIKTQLEEEHREDNNKKCVEKVLQFYMTHQEECDNSLSKYKMVDEHRRDYVELQQTITEQKFKGILSSHSDAKNILILTANDIENNILIYNLFKYSKRKLMNYSLDNGDKFICVNINYCRLNNYNIIHHHVGKTGDEYTRRAINEVTHYFKPSFIILLGICYGLDINKQELGMVEISEQITGVRINFRDEPNSNKIIFEPEIEFEEAPNSLLTNTVIRKLSNVEIISEEIKEPIKYNLGVIVSANSLMSCKVVKDAIMNKLKVDIKGKKSLIGGEMEACGIFKSNYIDRDGQKFDKWLVVKSICDWGESKNSIKSDPDENKHIKDSLQALAMMNTCCLFKHLIEKNAIR